MKGLHPFNPLRQSHSRWDARRPGFTHKTSRLPPDTCEWRPSRSACVPWHQHHHVVFLIHAVPPNVHIIPWVHRVLKKSRGGRIRALSHVDVIKAKPEVQYLRENESPSEEPQSHWPHPSRSLPAWSPGHPTFSYILYPAIERAKTMKTQGIQNEATEDFSRGVGLLPKSLLKQWCDLRRVPKCQRHSCVTTDESFNKIPSCRPIPLPWKWILKKKKKKTHKCKKKILS